MLRSHNTSNELGCGFAMITYRKIIIICFLLFYPFSSPALVIDEEVETDIFMYEEPIMDDPFEKFNRVSFKFNVKMDKGILHPLARDYAKIWPKTIPEMVQNFSENLYEPSNFLNAILQKKFNIALNAFWRFYLNSILGLGGLFEVAEPLGIPKVRISFEDTMIFYGADEGPYIILPFYPPSSLRTAFASILETFLNPLFFIIDNLFITFGIQFALLIPKRAEIVDIDLNSGIDPYAKWRSIFTQHNSSYEVY